MKILVPIDLYDSSYSSYEYAVQFAHQVDAEITLLYVVDSVFSSHEVIGFDPYLEMENTAKEKLGDFITQYSVEFGEKLPGVDTTHDVIFGIPGLAIAKYAETHDFELIIMGVRDKHGIFVRMLGSVSTETIKETKCSVLLINQKTAFKIPEKILFAFDRKTDLDDALESYKKLNNIIKAKTDFLHINVNKTDDVSVQKAEIVKELFGKDDPQFAFEVKTLRGKNVISALNDYCYFEKIDLVAMIHRKEGIFSNLFRSNKSIKLAQQFHLPVMVFQEC